MAEKALKEAVKNALLDHKLAGNPIAIWKDGKVIWIPAEKIPIRVPRKKARKLQLVLNMANKIPVKLSRKKWLCH